MIDVVIPYNTMPYDIVKPPSNCWFILPNMLTRLSWVNGTETVTHLVSLVDVSANGAAVNMDVKPVTDRPCMIHFENGGISTRPIPANLVAMETTDSGRILAKFAFDSVLADRDLILHQRERRAWQRVVPRERRACLSWRVGDDTISVPGVVQNISGGGVALQTDAAPPSTQGTVHTRPFSGHTRALSADPAPSRVGARLRECLVAVLGLQVRENRVYPRSSSQ